MKIGSMNTSFQCTPTTSAFPRKTVCEGTQFYVVTRFKYKSMLTEFCQGKNRNKILLKQKGTKAKQCKITLNIYDLSCP